MLETDLIERVKEALVERYDVSRVVGRGGMATVYLAQERHPNRAVAIKVLEPRLATDMARERFLREVEFSSQLNHPHIVPIFHAGEAEGLLYYVMPFIAGPTLRTRIAQNGRLPMDEALRIGIEVADALHYAHQNGVVHRDIKPENILLSNGHAVVADFGIARALCVACGDNLTVAGFPIGTPAYMSPEQGSGEEVDARADVYSLGAVVYEMLTGVAPFQGATVEAIIAARYTQPVPSLRDAGWSLSDTMDAAVQRALQLKRDARFNTTMDFINALRPRSAYAIPNTIGANTPAPTGTYETVSSPAVAVLPFTNLSSEADNEYFSDGVTEDIITQLSKIRGLRVTSRTSMLRYKSTNKAMSEIGRELGVQHLLEGSVRKAGNRIRVVAQLIDAKTDQHVWAERYDRELTDIFEIQSDIAERIAGALETTLTPTEKQRLHRKPTDDLDAYNLFLQGRFNVSRFTPAGITQGIELFQLAVERDAHFALAHAGLAEGYLLLSATAGLTPPVDAIPAAKSAALRALELDPNLSEAYATLGAVYDWYEWDWASAEASYLKAIELDKTAERPLVLLSFHYTAMGRHDEAIATAEKGTTVCRVSALARANVGFQLYHARRYEEALQQLALARKLDTTIPPVHILAGWIHLQLGNLDKALQAARSAADLTNHPPPRRVAVGCVLAAKGQLDKALKIYEELQHLRTERFVAASDLALLAAHLNRPDEAFDWLDHAVEERTAWMSQIKADPVWDPIRSDPRFNDIVRRVGLP